MKLSHLTRAYDQLALTRGAGSIVQFREVKAHRTDDSRDSRPNRDADNLADPGRLMDPTEYSVLPEQPPDEDERSTQPFQYRLDWDDNSDAPAPQAGHQDSVPHPVIGPVSDPCARVAVNHYNPVTLCLTAR